MTWQVAPSVRTATWLAAPAPSSGRDCITAPRRGGRGPPSPPSPSPFAYVSTSTSAASSCRRATGPRVRQYADAYPAHAGRGVAGV
eukprot:7411326-Pyramimonas_sp.AAC.1